MSENPYIDAVIWVSKAVYNITTRAIDFSRDAAQWLSENVAWLDAGPEVIIGFVLLLFFISILFR